MRSRILPLALLVLVAPLASAQWSVTRATDETGGAGVVLRQVDVAAAQTQGSARLNLAIFSNKSCRLRVIDNAAGSNDLADAMRGTDCVAGVNGGYFDPSFAPIGLRVSGGQVTSKLKHGKLMSGVLASNGAVSLLRVAEFSTRAKPTAAIECGPFLVEADKPVKGLEATRSARRTFAAVGRDGRAALGVCSDVTLAELGAILSGPLGDFRPRRALNFDGGSSTAFWCKRTGGTPLSIPEQKNVRDFVGIAPK